jgi:hypothetical protein
MFAYSDIYGITGYCTNTGQCGEGPGSFDPKGADENEYINNYVTGAGV